MKNLKTIDQRGIADAVAKRMNNPVGAFSGYLRVHRGGSWVYSASGCRVSYRNYSGHDGRSNDIGFRVVVLP